MGAAGEHNLGQLARQRHDGITFLIGQTTHHGTVTAASDWDMPAERKRVRPGLPGSYEALFHDVGLGAFMLPLPWAKATMPLAPAGRASVPGSVCSPAGMVISWVMDGVMGISVWRAVVSVGGDADALYHRHSPDGPAHPTAGPLTRRHGGH
jgi:hypothetical protein